MLNTFRMGGIHPPQEKHSAQIPLSYAKVPEKLLIPVNQHIGQPCEILVNKRDEVSRGMLLAKATGFISSNVHAPLDGVVEKIMKFPQLSGKIDQCILLKPKQTGQDYARIIAGDLTAANDPENIPAGEIRQRIAESGIVGMGGAGFPTHVKLTPPQEKRIDALIINGAECEPFITSDHRVMLEKSEEIIKGIRLLQRIFGQIPVYIGIEQNKPDASAKMRSAAQPFKNIFISDLQVKYPQGGEKQLIKAILKREVPSKGLPMDVGVIVQNVATVLAIHDAIYFGRPLMERVVTISGNIVEAPGNIVVPVGTAVSYLMDSFGIDPGRVKMVLNGGPMMGKTIFSLESPVTKTTSAILFFDEKAYVSRHENACIRCGNCIESCPMGLPVAQYAESIRSNQINKDDFSGILDCIECGSCAFSCPADRRLAHWLRLGKSMVKREMN